MSRKKRGSKLPSGTYRIRAYDYTDDEGKKHYKSFSGRTKAEASAKMAEWKEEKRELKECITVKRACEDYITLKEAVLSPSTVRAYRAYLKLIAGYPLGKTELSELKNMDVQRFVSRIAPLYSPKYIRNLTAFISSSVSVYLPKFELKLTMPQKRRDRRYIPTSGDVQELLNNCDTLQLKVAILFAAVGTMRRGEACAVTFRDINFKAGTVTVNKDMVYNSDSEWVIKPPKTYDSNRIIKFPESVMLLLKKLDSSDKDARVLGMNPGQLYMQFKRALKRAGLHDFRYHDLRHYAASSMHAAGVPERYIEAIGGWQPGSGVLKRVYENVLDTELVKIESVMSDRFLFTV